MPENEVPTSKVREPQPAATPIPQATQKKNSSSLLTILLLIFLYPLGVLVMWLEGKWSKATRILLSLPLIPVVLAIFLGPLLAVSLIAVNPARQFSQADNTKRRSDVNALLNAVHQYAADHNNTLPEGITTTDQEIAKNGADVCALLAPTYIAALPTDPKPITGSFNIAGENITDCTVSYHTGYHIQQNANGSVSVSAPGAELNESIVVAR